MSVVIQGIDRLNAKFDKVQQRSILRPPMQRSVYRLVRRMAEYPNAPSGSTYVRTGTLGRTWTSKITEHAGGLEGRVGNRTIYGPWVQSQRFQTALHRRTGWTTDEMAIRELEREIVADFERAIQEALR